MLHIHRMSGELTTLPAEEVSSVRGVKRRLQELHDLPPRFRQRLLVQGSTQNLDDDYELGSAGHLELVMLPLSSPSNKQMTELINAAGRGSVQEAGVSGMTVIKQMLLEAMRILVLVTCLSYHSNYNKVFQHPKHCHGIPHRQHHHLHYHHHHHHHHHRRRHHSTDCLKPSTLNNRNQG